MQFTKAFSGNALFARAMRGSAITAGSYALSQALRLASNLLLTRLLFPEAFGLMALVSVLLVGMQMFSDVGIGPAISQNRRGDDPDFLDTAWTIMVIRGALMWLATCALAVPVARFYDAPDLTFLLPVAGLALLITGFNPTRIDTATRHLMMGRLMGLDLLAQAIGIASMVVLAYATGSVWSLVFGSVIGAIARQWLMMAGLPGRKNRFRWETSAGAELLHFGKWIFLSTACGFLLAQGDKAILGAYLPLEALGIYNIGYFLASFPILLGYSVVGRILIPIYRDKPPAASAANFALLRRMRFGLTGGLMALLAVMAFGGVPLVGLLYDARYAAAGGIVVAIACVQLPLVIGMGYDQAALAAGDSRNYFLLQAAKALVQTVLFLIGAEFAGLIGALAAQGLALALVHPLIIWLARRHGAWDALHDGVFALLALAVAAAALWLNQSAVLALLG